MSAYCTQSEIEGEIQFNDLVQLTDDSNPPLGVVNDTVLKQIIANASGVIDRYVSNQYDVPFSPVPTAVRSMAITIACYKLYRRRLVPDEKNNFTEDYNRAIDFLEKVNSGNAILDLTTERAFSQVAANTVASPWGSGNSLASSR